jgi:hypothetical protein
VHRVVLPYRAWEMLELIGQEQAHTLLRQSVRYCVKAENWSRSEVYDRPRKVLPAMMEKYGLLDKTPGKREADDAMVEKLGMTIFSGTPETAAEAAASTLAEGFAPDVVGEAISLAANQLILRDMGRTPREEVAGKPLGSVHGDSIGVHSCDTVHAWRNLSRAGDRRTQVTSLILAGYQVARDRTNRAEFLKWEPYPRSDAREKVRGLASDALMKALGAAIREKDQPRTAAITARIGTEMPDSGKDVFGLLREFAVSEDGALHAEKYYGTTSDEFATMRPAFKWRQLVALARVTASAFGYPAPGHDEACKLVKKA